MFLFRRRGVYLLPQRLSSFCRTHEDDASTAAQKLPGLGNLILEDTPSALDEAAGTPRQSPYGSCETFLDRYWRRWPPRNKVLSSEVQSWKGGTLSSKFFTSSFAPRLHPGSSRSQRHHRCFHLCHTFCSQQEASGGNRTYRLGPYHRYQEYSDNRHALMIVFAHLTSGTLKPSTGMSFTSKGSAHIICSAPTKSCLWSLTHCRKL